MNKQIKILKIMKEKKVDWEEAQELEKERKELDEFFQGRGFIMGSLMCGGKFTS